MTTVGISVFEGAEELDLVGPWEVLDSWAHHCSGDGIRVLTVAETGENLPMSGP